MREINYEALRGAAQSYQSTLAWCQATPDSPNVKQDCDATLAAFKRHIHHQEAGIITGLLDGLGEAKSQFGGQREYYGGVILDESKRIAEPEAREVQLPIRYDLRYGHPVNADKRHVMVPGENNSWFYLIDLEHALHVTGIRIRGEEHRNKTRGRVEQYRFISGKRG